MLILAMLSISGLIAGFLLLRIVPTVPALASAALPQLPVSIIIPARNEAANLPPLLSSITQSALAPAQVIVVDDASTDATASVAQQHGVNVLLSDPLPPGWTGKTWAIHQGAHVAGEVLFFLDADTRFTPSGYSQIVAHFAGLQPDSALSILPYHRVEEWYEELSLFFNILIAMGAGGFGKLDRPRLFGQSLLISHGLYDGAGGHAAVRREILENLHLASHVRSANGTPHALGGRGTLEMHMFPDGLAQLHESWQKAFVSGASTTSPVVLALSILWLSAAMLTAILAIGFRTPLAFVLYLLTAAQIFFFARQLGTFRLSTALLYPIPLAFYFTVFAQSLSRRKRRQPATWRGRQV